MQLLPYCIKVQRKALVKMYILASDVCDVGKIFSLEINIFFEYVLCVLNSQVYCVVEKQVLKISDVQYKFMHHLI